MDSSATAPERRHTFTYDEYIRIAEHGDIRLEFWHGVIFDMAGGSPRHSAICNNIGGILRAQPRGGACRAYAMPRNGAMMSDRSPGPILAAQPRSPPSYSGSKSSTSSR